MKASMKKYISLFVFLLVGANLLAQDRVELVRAVTYSNVIDVTLGIKRIPWNYLHLIKFDSIKTTTDNGTVLLSSKTINNIYREIEIQEAYLSPEEDFKTINVSGTMIYFKPTKDNNSYIDLGHLQHLKKNVNLLNNYSSDKSLYFEVLDLNKINEVLPKLRIRNSSTEDFENVDFTFYDLMIASSSKRKQGIIPIINGKMNAGYSNYTIKLPNSDITYMLIKLRRDMTEEDRQTIKIELLIENDQSIQSIPFEFNNLILRQ